MLSVAKFLKEFAPLVTHVLRLKYTTRKTAKVVSKQTRLIELAFVKLLNLASTPWMIQVIQLMT